MNKTLDKNSLSSSSLRYLAASVFLLLLVLLSACSAPAISNTPGSGSTPTTIATPTVSAALQKQGDAQLQTYQQWIALMQQYQGDVTTYQQQYNSDQQALHAATG